MANYFSKNLRYLRERKKIEQQKMSDDLNIPRSTLSCWENGLRTPKIEQIQQIAKYFNVDIDIISRDYSLPNNSEISELDHLLFSKAKELTDEEKKAVISVMNAIHKDIDKELDN